jgi:hypothetical protein
MLEPVNHLVKGNLLWLISGQIPFYAVFTAKVVGNWLGRIEFKTLLIEPGSPWENGYNESFNMDCGLFPLALSLPSIL